MKKNILWSSILLLPLCASAATPPANNLVSATPQPLNVVSNASNYPSGRAPDGPITWTQLPPEMKALARTLGADHYAASRITAAEYAQNVYDYVHNNIDTEFRFGLGKGARGALIDQSGTPFDQAELMVKLIRSVGITAQFQVGNITLSENDFGRWTGLVRAVVESTQTVDVDARSACQFLADAGIPTNLATDCTALTGDLSTVTMAHIWVTAAGKSFDPSFKLYTIHQGLTDLTTRLGCASTACGTGAMNAALSGADTTNKYGFPAIKNVNETQLATYLTARGNALANYLKGNTARRLTSIPEIVSGKRLLDPVSVAAPATLPYASTPTLTWSGEIPDSFRTRLRIRFDDPTNGIEGDGIGADRTFFADELAGRRLQLSASLEEPNILGFFIDGTDGTPYQMLVSANTCSGCKPGVVILDVDHPYASNSNTYADEHRELSIGGFSSNGLRTTFPVTILHGFGNGSASTERHYSALQETQADANEYTMWWGADGINHYEIYRSADHVIPAAKLRNQGALADRIISGLAHAQINRHHDIGVVFSDTQSPGSAFMMSMVSAVSVTPDVSDTDGLTRRNLAFHTTSATWALLEGSVNQEIDRSDVGVSLAGQFHFGNSLPAANRWAFLDLTQAQLQSSAFTGITNFASYYKSALNGAGAAGFAGIITDRTNGGELLTQANSVGYTMGTVVKGGAAASLDPVGKAVESAKVGDVAAERKKYLAVSPADGGVTLTQTDLVTGEGAFPASLALQRVYKSDVSVSEEIIEGWSNADTDQDSQQYPRSYRYSGPDSAATSRIGGGWTHNFNVILTLAGNGAKGLGSDSAVEGAGAIAALWTMLDLQRNPAFSSRLTTVFTSYWLGSKLAFNTASLDKGGAAESFFKLPDGSYFNMRGDARLVQTGTPNAGNDFIPVTFVYTGTGGDTISFDWMKSRRYPRYSNGPPAIGDPVFKANSWNFPDGQVVTFTYTGAFMVGSWSGSPKWTECDINGACRPGDTVEMTLPYGFVLKSVSNNRGRSLTFTSDTLSVKLNANALMSFDTFGTNQYRITKVTAEDGRAVQYFMSDCPSIGTAGLSEQQPARAVCEKLTVRAPDGSDTVFSYVAGADSPDPAVLQRTDYRLRRWYASLTPPPATPFRVVKYDEIFRALSVTDPLGHATFYYPGGVTGTERWKRAEIVSAMGFVSRSVFDDKNSVLSSRDPLGRETRSIYDNAGRLTRTIMPEGNAETRNYDIRSNVTQSCQLSKARGTQTCSVGQGDLVTDTVYVEGTSVTTCVNPASCNKPLRVTNPRRYVTRNTWNLGTGELERIETGLNTSLVCALASGDCPQTDAVYSAPAGTTIRMLDNVTQKISATESRVSKFTYDSANFWVPKTATADYGTGAGFLNQLTTLTFDATGNLTQIDGPRTGVNDIKNFTWDLRRRLTTAIEADPDGAGPLPRPAVRTVYDVDGLVTSSRRGTTTNATGSDFVAAEITSFDYDAAGNKIRETSPAGIRQMSFDDDDRPLCSVVRMNPGAYASLPTSACTLGPEGTMGPDRITKFNYDAAGQVLSEQRSLGTPWQQNYYTAAYTTNGKQDWVEDANGNRSEFVYDAFDRLCRLFMPSPTLGAHAANVGTGAPATLDCSFTPTSADYEQYGYDANGNRTSYIKRRGTGTASANTISFTYDALDRETLKNMPGGTTTDVYSGYDLMNRKLYAHFAAAGTASSTCADATAPNGIDYCYDRLGRLAIERRDERAMSYAYDVAGNRTKVSWPGGASWVAYTYDAMNRMKVVCENGVLDAAGNADCSATPLATYNYDNLGRRGTITRANNTTTTLGYDGASRLTSVQQDVASNAFDVTFGLPSYNPASQVLQRTINTASYVYNTPVGSSTYVPDGLNRYSSYTAPGASAATFGYDARGNLTSDGAASSRRDFVYDLDNRMTSASVGGATALTLSYDPLGRLKQTIAGGSTTQYLYDGDKLTAEYNGSATTPMRRYVHGSGVDEPLVWLEDTVSPTAKRWYHTDHQGSVVAVSDSSGNVTSADQYVYSPYGEPNSWTGSRFRYTGQIALNDAPNLKLYYYKARVYDPSIGRFLQTDPIGYKDDYDLYAYVGNDPVNRTDPTGLEDVLGINVSQSFGEGLYYGIDNVDMDRFKNDKEYRNGVLADAVVQALMPDAGNINRITPRKPCCFVAGTEVTTSAGPRAIETIRIGDLVLARDMETGAQAFKPVTELFVDDEKPIWEIEVTNQVGETETHRVTGEHPYWVVGRGWTPVAELRPAYELLTQEGASVRVTAVHATGLVERTYNLEVLDFHSYFVGRQHVLVHNCGEKATVVQNQQRATRQENKLARELAKKEPVGQRVTLETSKGTRTVADIVTDPNGSNAVVEKKGGSRSEMSQGQMDAMDDVMNGRPLIPRGENAAAIGLKPGQPHVFSCYVTVTTLCK